jgi:hypothetical protein
MEEAQELIRSGVDTSTLMCAANSAAPTAQATSAPASKTLLSNPLPGRVPGALHTNQTTTPPSTPPASPNVTTASNGLPFSREALQHLCEAAATMSGSDSHCCPSMLLQIFEFDRAQLLHLLSALSQCQVRMHACRQAGKQAFTGSADSLDAFIMLGMPLNC